MPISHARMLRLIQAAEALQLAAEYPYQAIVQKQLQIAKGELTYQQAWQDLSLEIQAYRQPTNALLAIAEERFLYNRNRSHNEYERKRQERLRRSLGMKQQIRKPDPDMLAGPSTLLSDAANLARIKAEIEATDNLPDDHNIFQEQEQYLTPAEQEAYNEWKARGRK